MLKLKTKKNQLKKELKLTRQIRDPSHETRITQ